MQPGAPLQPEGDPSPLRELLAVAGPAVVTMISPAIMQFVDAVMVARLGPTAVAAQGNGAMATFIVMAVIAGLVSVINTFAAQNFGAKRFDRCGRYGWTGVWLSLWCSILVLPLVFFVDDFFRLIGHGQGSDASLELLRLETEYATILLAFAVFPSSVARGLGQFFYGIHRPNVVMVATIAANLVNIVASYFLIFGVAGLPALGVAGAAIGTVIGHVVEMLVPMALFLSREFDAKYATRHTWRPAWAPLRETLKLGWPAAFHFGNEVACWGLFMSWVVPAAVLPADAPAAIAASYIALNWLKLGFLPVVGLSFGVTAVVGAQIGKGNADGASHRAMLGVKLGMLYMLALGVLMLLLREPMVRIFVDKDAALENPELASQTLAAGAKIVALMAIFQAFDALGIVMGGALRGAGDTTWPGVVMVASGWSILIGGGFVVGAVLPDLGSVGPWLAAGLYLGVSGSALLWRFKAGKWRTFDLLNRDPGEAPTLVAS